LQSILDWLESSAQRTPQKIAVADPDSSLTYAELRSSARRIGSWLVSNGVRPRTAVALYAEKSPDVLAAMLGVVYAGGFYSVIDVRQPEARVHSMCEALQPALVLTDATNIERARNLFDSSNLRVIQIEELPENDPDDQELATVRAQTTDVDPLYVNFTSGSTGIPKGVVVSHRSVIDFIPVFVATFGITSDDVVANQAPFDFDVSVKDIYTCLLTGATLRIVPRPYFSNPTQLMDYLCDCEATTLVWAVSALCFVSIMGGLDYRVPHRLRRVLFSGEVMPPKQLAIWQEHLPRAQFVNLYGPTEITCNCTYFCIDRRYDAQETIPMGRPFANERVFLLDEHDQLVEPSAVGVVGEVCVSGTCLALGYLGDTQRTSQAFVQNPLNHRWMEPIYRTGDLAHYDKDANLVFSSRKDHQIKHLGQRIELGDIEAAAQGIDGVDRAVCLYDSNRKRLILCYVGSLDRKGVKGRLRTLLPSYMVPNNTRQLDQMPLNKNGKIDRSALATMARITR
jgi:amino acid adenylation domain-containing protein